MSNDPGLHPFLMPIGRIGQMVPLSNNIGVPLSNNMGSQLLMLPNKQIAQMKPISNSGGSQQLSAAIKRAVQKEPMPNKQGSQHLSIPKKRTAEMDPSPKGQTESFELVRSKLRESLASSLALVSQQQNKLPPVGKSSQSDAGSAASQVNEGSQPAETTTTTVDVASCHVSEKPLETLLFEDHDSSQKHGDSRVVSSQDVFINESTEDAAKIWKYGGQELQVKDVSSEKVASFSDNYLIKDELLQGNGLCWSSDRDAEIAETFSETKESHSAKRPKLVHEEVSRDGEDPALQSPQALATRIEAELFKLFGGVNKKYKEKGRSLLFNLKDRSNPELRERVMSGEISPERLCSMTAEELASEELSQWRIAKAEELAHMIVLPDSEVDVRRLVKKTHKGEFQVEVEQDDSVSVEVSVGASSFSEIRFRSKEKGSQFPSNPNDTETYEVAIASEKSNLEDQNPPSEVTTLPNDGTDIMQGLVEDELKDAEFLPPVLSLDEFMESLDSEPPFEKLLVDAGQSTPVSGENKSSSVDSKLDSSELGLADTLDNAPDELIKTVIKDTWTDNNMKSSDIHIELETSAPGGLSKGEHVWEGLLQLNISAMVTVTGFFTSGEKTSTEEWPNFLEIKGRVRLDAFEKFLQELPMSRSRAIMVVQLCWKEGSPEDGRANLSEVVDSYIMDERVGFAEPAPGVELYFCPPHTRTLEMLGKHLPKDHTETLNAIDSGLIGVVIWRRNHVNSSSHHKLNSKKQQYALKRQQERDANANSSVNAISKPSMPLGKPPTNPEPWQDDELTDDVPPGFGPAAARDEDDLPEFDFVRGSNPPVSKFMPPNPSQGLSMAPFHPSAQQPHPAKQMRELIQKYGQGKTNANSGNWQQRQAVGVEVQPWNDDDDDIPEWQPQPLQQQLLPPPPPPPPLHSLQQQMLLPPHMINGQHLVSMPFQQPPPCHQLQPLMPVALHLPMPPQPFQPPVNVMQPQQTGVPNWQQGGWWAHQSATYSNSTPGNGLMQPSHFGEGQIYGIPNLGAGQHGMDWRQDVPRSRGY